MSDTEHSRRVRHPRRVGSEGTNRTFVRNQLKSQKWDNLHTTHNSRTDRRGW